MKTSESFQQILIYSVAFLLHFLSDLHKTFCLFILCLKTIFPEEQYSRGNTWNYNKSKKIN